MMEKNLIIENGQKESKNDSYRRIEISDFRNIGLFENKSIMTLNRSLEKRNLGDLVILIGPNNSGKSNVLDALMSLAQGCSSEDDVCDMYFNQAQKPSLRFVVRNGDQYYSKNSLYVGGGIVAQLEPGKPLEAHNRYKIQMILSEENLFVNNDKISNNRQIRNPYNLTDTRFIQTVETVRKALKNGEIISSEYIDFIYRNYNKELFDNYNMEMILSSESEYCLSIKEKNVENSKDNHKNNEFLNEFGYDLVPNVISYVKRPIGQSDLKSDYESLNDFFKSLLSILNVNPEDLVANWHNSKKRNQSSILTRFEQELNKSLEEKITKKFNKMYLAGNSEYEFRFKLNDLSANFEIYDGNTALNLDYQSTGFRWFFEFYFGFICNNGLKWGDIIIMDEPATNLHVSGQIELRSFLKEFARENGLTFIISTHSPFLVDCDNLDEVRIMEKSPTGGMTIRDKFAGLPEDSIEQTNEVFKALTVGRHMLMNPDSKVYYVEGITDYNYLTAFKKLFGMTNIFFIPINGLKQDSFISRLLNLDKNPSLIVDGDQIGLSMVKEADGTGVLVIPISNANPSFKNIEDLFSKEDKEKFNVADKSFNKTSVFKNAIFDIAPDISDITKKNFEKLLKYLDVA